jgi:hypothetical protein
MSTQSSSARRTLSALVERAVDRFGVLFLLILGVSTAGATMLVGG